jgi:DNA-binding transcriptional LysR family regulator
MKISLDALRVLDAIDRHGSYAAAGLELHRVASAISYAIQKLEDDLDLTVFDRSGHRAQLTEVGRALLADGRQLLEHARRVEARARQLATGWEAELVIAVEDLIGVSALTPALCEFYALAAPTRLRVTSEVLGGGWDAVLSQRADLAVGAPGDAPPGSGHLNCRPLGYADFIFAVAPHHPLAHVTEPIDSVELDRHRLVSVADTSRALPARNAGISGSQDTLTVPTLAAKLAMQVAGLGVGHLPRHLAQPHLERGTLIAKTLAEPQVPGTVSLVWRGRDRGPALTWWLDKLSGGELPGVTPNYRVAP